MIESQFSYQQNSLKLFFNIKKYKVIINYLSTVKICSLKTLVLLKTVNFTIKRKTLTLLENEGLFVAVWTGLEPATPCVTGMYSNQLNYQTVFIKNSFLQKRCKYKLFFQLAKHLFYKKSC